MSRRHQRQRHSRRTPDDKNNAKKKKKNRPTAGEGQSPRDKKTPPKVAKSDGQNDQQQGKQISDQVPGQVTTEQQAVEPVSTKSQPEDQQNKNWSADEDDRQKNQNKKDLSMDDDSTCPVCLEPTADPDSAYTDTCRHRFCRRCIVLWSTAHNHCPVCRTRYDKIRYNIRGQFFDEQLVPEPTAVAGMRHRSNNSRQLAFLMVLGPMTVLRTPADVGLYLISRRRTPHGDKYDIVFYGPNQAHIVLTNGYGEANNGYGQVLVIVHPDSIGVFLPDPFAGGGQQQQQEVGDGGDDQRWQRRGGWQLV